MTPYQIRKLYFAPRDDKGRVTFKQHGHVPTQREIFGMWAEANKINPSHVDDLWAKLNASD